MLRQFADDQTKCCEGLVDVRALLESVPLGPGLVGPLGPGEVHQGDPGHLGARHPGVCVTEGEWQLVCLMSERK